MQPIQLLTHPFDLVRNFAKYLLDHSLEQIIVIKEIETYHSTDFGDCFLFYSNQQYILEFRQNSYYLIKRHVFKNKISFQTPKEIIEYLQNKKDNT